MDKNGRIAHGPQTNIDGDICGQILSGQQDGPVTINNYYSKSVPFRPPVQKPPRPEKFIGRENEVADLLRDLKPERRVTICGPGGIGKTALAAEAIWRLAPDNNPPASFPDGIIFHDFYRQPQAIHALEAIAYAYGGDLRPGISTAARRALAGRQALLVLDGTEAADDLDAVLEIAGCCCVLVTSHKHSDAPAEWSDLRPLPIDYAARLLRDWGKGWAADEAICYRICELLGGLPLAVFLAGRYLAQHKLLAAEYLDWLEEAPLDALDMGDQRHQSIPLLMDRTTEKISEMGRVALGIVGILSPEPFESKLIQIALGMKPKEANRHLGELVNYGLLQRQTIDYQVTHSLIHAYARKRFAVNPRVLSRLTGYYISFIKKQCNLGHSGYKCLDAHRAHILALQSNCHDAGQKEATCSITWAIKDYLDLRGYWIDRILILEKGLSSARAANDRYGEGAFLTSLGWTYNKLGKYRQAKDLLEQALAIAQQMKDRDGEGGSLINIAISCNLLGEHKKAIELCDLALSIAKEIEDNDLESAAINNKGIAFYYLGETRLAIDYYKKGLSIIQENENKSKEANALCCLGVAFSDLGENQLAIEFYEKYWAIASKKGNRQAEGNYLCNMGIIYNNLGDCSKSIKLFERALVIFRDIGDRLGEGNALHNMSLALNKNEERGKAIENATSALTIFEKIESPRAAKAKRNLAEWKVSEHDA